ncbi:MAG: SufE family protein [Hyphomicrobiales bacterium]|nr:SufE family protein [Hyphomicrobiales bacterium]
MSAIDEIVDNFSLLDDWEDRYRYVIELGNALEPLSEAEHSDQYKVRGCASQVWLVSMIETGHDGKPLIVFRGDSDAHIVRGLIAILIAVYSGRTADFIADYDAEALFAELGLGDHLTQQRSNGLASMVARIRSDAAAVLQSN